jgi:hypothetical protein
MKIGSTLEVFFRRIFPSVAMISLAIASCSKAQTLATGEKSTEAPGLAFVGCYEMMLGRWWPWSFGGDTVFVTPPRRIRLLATRGTNGFEKDQFLLRAIPDTKASIPAREGPSYWQPKSDKQVDLVWTTDLLALPSVWRNKEMNCTVGLILILMPPPLFHEQNAWSLERLHVPFRID